MQIPLACLADYFTRQDDPRLWQRVLAVLDEEFIQRYREESKRREDWYLRIGACSHWIRPHQSRWTAAGGFAWPVGYKGAASMLSDGLPEFDWSVILRFDGEWARVGRFSRKRQIVLRAAVPTRTMRHKQAAVHTMWSTSHRMTFYGFRNIEGIWICVAASDEDQHGRIARETARAQKGAEAIIGQQIL